MTRTLTGIDQDENPLAGIPQYKTITADGSGNANGVGPGTTGHVLTSNGPLTYPSYQAPTTSYTNLTVTNNLTLSAIISKYLLTDGAGLVIGSTTIPTSALTGTLGVSNGGTGQTSFTNGALTSTSNTVSGGTLSVSYGGTGNTTLSSGQYLKGAGTSAITSTSTIPTSDLSGTVSLTTQVSGTLPISNGGTGQTSFASGVIKSNGSALSSGLVDLTTQVTGVLPVANGGTGTLTLPKFVLLTGTGTYNSPATCRYFKVTAVGAGGGGGSSNSSTAGGGGGSGAVVIHHYAGNAAYTYTCGTKGVGASSADGTAGTATTFHTSAIIAAGGLGGKESQGNELTGPGGLGGALASCTVPTDGVGIAGNSGYSSYWHNGAQGAAPPGFGGASVPVLDGAGTTPATTSYGCGGGAGGGNAGNNAGGDGVNGAVYILEYY